jgi:outer membrane protein OmpA-like peptidoglycan-associated protein
MNRIFLATTAISLFATMPASAQILGGGGLGGRLGGTIGGAGGRIDTTIGGTLDRGRIATDRATRARERAEREARRDRRRTGVTGVVTGDAALTGTMRRGERPIVANGSAVARGEVGIEQRMLYTRGAVAASRRGLRRVAPTASGVQVFVPAVSIAAPVGVPRVAVPAYPAYSSVYYYGGPGAVFVDRGYVDVYVEQQYQDLESALRGTGATVSRRGDDLIVALPADVTFAFDKSDIRPRFYGVLTAFAETLNAYPGTDVEVIGHTDAVGSDSYNLALSERRGRTVAEFLVARRTEPARLVVEAMGESEPIASNATVEGRAANRRVELIVHPRVG